MLVHTGTTDENRDKQGRNSLIATRDRMTSKMNGLQWLLFLNCIVVSLTESPNVYTAFLGGWIKLYNKCHYTLVLKYKYCLHILAWS